MSNGVKALDVTVLITLVTALIYAAGWSYAYHWYDRFDLGLIGLGIPFEYHIMYGFWVLEMFWWLVLILAGLVAATITWWGRLGRSVKRAAPLWVPVAFVLIYLLAGAAARADYGLHRDGGFVHYPWVRVWLGPLADTDPEPLKKLHQDLAEARYRLLLQTGTSLYLIKPQSSGESPIIQLPQSQVRALRRIPTNPGGP
jgi:hypothetical protein